MFPLQSLGPFALWASQAAAQRSCILLPLCLFSAMALGGRDRAMLRSAWAASLSEMLADFAWRR